MAAVAVIDMMTSRPPHVHGAIEMIKCWMWVGYIHGLVHRIILRRAVTVLPWGKRTLAPHVHSRPLKPELLTSYS